MTITVETGQLESGANSFVSLATFKTYSDAIGDTGYVDAGDTASNTALINAANYLSRRYTWRGERLSVTQVLPWPRQNVMNDDGFTIEIDAIPQAVKDAQCEAAIRILANGKLIPDISADQIVSSKQVSISGAISQSLSYTGMPVARYPEINAILRGLIYRPTSMHIRRS